MKRRHDIRPLTTTADEFVRCTEVFIAQLKTARGIPVPVPHQCIKADGHQSESIEHKAVIPGGVVRWRVKSERRK